MNAAALLIQRKAQAAKAAAVLNDAAACLQATALDAVLIAKDADKAAKAQATAQAAKADKERTARQGTGRRRTLQI